MSTGGRRKNRFLKLVWHCLCTGKYVYVLLLRGKGVKWEEEKQEKEDLNIDEDHPGGGPQKSQDVCQSISAGVKK